LVPGKKVEREAKRRKISRTCQTKSFGVETSVDLGFVDCDYFVDSVNEAREFLVSFLVQIL
jgi:hypothetical protein